MAKRYGHVGNQALRDAADVLGAVRIPAQLCPTMLDQKRERDPGAGRGLRQRLGFRNAVMRIIIPVNNDNWNVQ